LVSTEAGGASVIVDPVFVFLNLGGQARLHIVVHVSLSRRISSPAHRFPAQFTV